MATVASTLIHRHVTGEDVSWMAHTRAQPATILFLAPAALIMFFMMVTVRAEFDPINIGCALVGIVSLALCAHYSGLPAARLLGVVRPASPRLQALVDEVTAALGTTPDAVEKMDLPMWNAMALPSCNRLVFTTRTVEDLDDDALRSIIAHEIGHLQETSSWLWLRRIPVLGYLLIGLIPAAWDLLGSLGGAIVYIGAMLSFPQPFASSSATQPPKRSG